MALAPVFLVTTQRSGSNLLRSLLVSTRAFVDFNEIFQRPVDPSWPIAAFNFHSFRVRRLARDPELSVPIRENLQRLFQDYLDEMASRVDPGVRPLIDVKYNALSVMSTIPQDPFRIPRFLEFLRDLQLPVIHLVRRNLLRTHVSKVFADHHGVYTVRGAAPPPQGKVSIEVEGLVEDLERRTYEMQRLGAFIRDHIAGSVEVAYEDLCSGVHPRPGGFPALEEALGVALPELQASALQRMIGDPAEVVTNWDQVRAALRGTRFEGFLEEPAPGAARSWWRLGW